MAISTQGHISILHGVTRTSTIAAVNTNSNSYRQIHTSSLCHYDIIIAPTSDCTVRRITSLLEKDSSNVWNLGLGWTTTLENCSSIRNRSETPSISSPMVAGCWVTVEGRGMAGAEQWRRLPDISLVHGCKGGRGDEVVAAA